MSSVVFWDFGCYSSNLLKGIVCNCPFVIIQNMHCAKPFKIWGFLFVIFSILIYFGMNTFACLLRVLWGSSTDNSSWISVPSIHLPVQNQRLFTRKRCEISSESTIETLENGVKHVQSWLYSNVFIVNLKHISHPHLLILLLSLNW